MQRVISSCEQCIQHEDIHAKAPVWLIIVTTPLELFYVDLTSIETMMKLDQPPTVVNLLVFCNHFIKHVMAYMAHNQTAKTLAKFLGQGYISIIGATAKLLSDWGANLKGTSYSTLWAYWHMEDLGLHFTMLRPMNRWNELTKCWCAW